MEPQKVRFSRKSKKKKRKNALLNILKPLISLEMHFQAFQGVKRTNKLFFKTNDVFLMLCTTCNRFRHMTADCYCNNKSHDSNNNKRNRLDNSKQKDSESRPSKKTKYKQSNVAKEEESAVCIETSNKTHENPSYNEDEVIHPPLRKEEEKQPSITEEEAFDFYEPSDVEDVVHYSDNDMTRPMYIDCLADTGTTSHVFNDRTVFIDYHQIDNIFIGGVGGTKTRACGRGTIRLLAEHNKSHCIIKLRDVHYVPDCKHNLISLGRWEESGQSYQAQNGKLKLYSSDSTPVIQGERAPNHLYLFWFQQLQSTSHPPDDFAFTASKQSWDIWHRRFGHIGYSGLQMLRDKALVRGFIPDPLSQKTDCFACAQAKIAHHPFPSTATHTSTIGNLTHIDLWGKYAVQSIHGNQYYILFVDDYSRYVTVKFLKSKTEAQQCVRDYLTHLITRDFTPNAIRVDRGTEFINDNLNTWCTQRGIDIQMTAPYSLSQNGVAEHMNRTLVELAHAMLTARQLPEFLWEPAVTHASYLRNRSFTCPVPDSTPYERRHGIKPDVSHLREFGSPVWILTEGPNTPRKMLPKSTEKLLLGFDDGARAVKYYSKDTRKVLTSRNYQYVNSNNTLPTVSRQPNPTNPPREEEPMVTSEPGPSTQRIGPS
jgi:transposase InsO family protein